jgi:alpha-D-ribose 1-methylphosphonate 5-triphosphate diphosphatase
MVTATPAERVALADRGEIVAGRRGDLLQVRVIGEHAVVRGVWRAGRRIA